MAALPSPTQVAGNHSAIYEALYNYVDPKGIGTVGAMDAALFLKKSGLSDVVLSRVWDLSDPGGRGCLDKAGMYVALKLVAVAQSGRDINIANVSMELPPPKMGDVPLPKPTPLITSLPPSAVDWTIKPMEREKYDKLFDSLQPLNGMIPGNKVKGVLMDSKLPVDTLGKIWELADQDKDGMLDRHEFVVAMHLVYKALEKHAIPNTLPPELMPPTKRKGSTPMGPPLISRGIDGVKPELPPPPVIQSLNNLQNMSTPANVPPPVPKPIQPVQPTLSWVVNAEEKAKSDALFIKSDIDRDGFVSGQEIKDVFLRSGVPQPVLAHIWALCDIKQSGKLNNEQFALAMWFVARCLKGLDPPLTLTPEMVPPSFRTTKPNEGLVENNNTCYSNPELDMASKDIEELAREKLSLETDIAQKEADIKIKSGEVKSLQSELDTLAATLKQLENQKGEAQKRLNDLKSQRSTVVNELEDVNKDTDHQSDKVDKLRMQASEQAETVAAQEAELNSKKQQLEGLKQEEQRLEQQKVDNSRKLEQLTSKLQDTQLNISQAKAMITQLEEQTRQMKDAITSCDTAIDSGDPALVPDTALRISADFRDPNIQKLGMVNGDTATLENGFDGKDDPFVSRNGAKTGFDDDPFKDDPFKNNSDGFGANDPFSSGFSEKNDGFSSDPFSSFNNPTNTGKADPFDAFGDSKHSVTPTEVEVEPEKDPFGCDPFAVLHAPTRDGAPPGRPSSPSPALPPKKSKQPPPRPAPPRPQPPSISKPQTADPFTPDPFGSSAGFANFADFDSKFSDKPTPGVLASSTNKNKKPTSSSTTATTKTKTIGNKTMDFTDDPFRDYRYEDPFNIKFDSDDDDLNKNDNNKINNNNSNEMKKKKNINNDKFDPFGLDGRQSVPISKVDPFDNSVINNNNNNSGRSSVPLPTSKRDNNNKLLSEDYQLAWAARESLKLEEDRKQTELQEQADLELAIALSKVDNK